MAKKKKNIVGKYKLCSTSAHMAPAVPRSVNRVGKQKGRFKGRIRRKRKSSGLLTSLFRSFFFQRENREQKVN